MKQPAEVIPFEPSQPRSAMLGTARWMNEGPTLQKLRYSPHIASGRIWIGEEFSDESYPLGHDDDRHVCLVSGTRGGKGTSIIIPNLCLWPGSCIVIDPKGENAIVTAERRGKGSAYAHGMVQDVYNLDPFNESKIDPSYSARFNPLDIIDPNSDFAIDDAAQVAASIVAIENKKEPEWEINARELLKGLILYVLASPDFAGRRNLLTVRKLLSEGDWLALEAAERLGEKDASGFILLWQGMRRCKRFGGVVRGVGEKYLYMADKQRSGIMASASSNTEFIDSPFMQRILETSDFSLSEIKTNPKGVTLYLTLPRRYMDSHFRWLRMMVTLAVGEMERIKEQPATGHRTLFLLDEFAGLKRMEIIEHAAAQAAGFGVKLFFVLQNLSQLQEVYDKSWESFMSYSGIKLFFQVDDQVTRKYVSDFLGEKQVVIGTRTETENASEAMSKTTGTTKTTNKSISRGDTSGVSSGKSLNYEGIFRWFSSSESAQTGRNASKSTNQSEGSADGVSLSEGETTTLGRSRGINEGVHKRALINPDEVGRMFGRIDDRGHPVFPGAVLALISGQDPLTARRVNYFESPHFAGLYGPNRFYQAASPTPTLNERAEIAAREAAERARLLGIKIPPLLPNNKKSAQKPFYQLPIFRYTAIASLFLIGLIWAVTAYILHDIQVRQTGPENSVVNSNLGRTAINTNAIVKVDNSNLMSSPNSATNSLVATIPRGVKVRVISSNHGFDEIQVKSTNGDTLSGYALSSDTEWSVDPNAVVTGSALNLFEKQDPDSKVTANLHQGNEVRIIGSSSRWVEVETVCKSGYSNMLCHGFGDANMIELSKVQK